MMIHRFGNPFMQNQKIRRPMRWNSCAGRQVLSVLPNETVASGYPIILQLGGRILRDSLVDILPIALDTRHEQVEELRTKLLIGSSKNQNPAAQK
jgi:hypothetical protein